MSIYTTLENNFETVCSSQKDHSSKLSDIRKEAFQLFEKEKFPTIKSEEWRFTNITPFLNDDFSGALYTPEKDEIEKAITKSQIKDLEAYELIMINGVIDFSLSSLPGEKSITIQPVSTVENSAFFLSVFNKNISLEKSPLSALNTALFSDGYFIEIKQGSVIEKPLHIRHFYFSKENVFIHPRHLVVVNKHASAEIIETAVTVGNNRFFVNELMEILIDENANFTHTVLQDNNSNTRWVEHTQVSQQQNSNYNNYTISLPTSAFTRNNLNIVLEGSNTESHLYGLYLAQKDQLIDNHSLVDHRCPNCNSNQLYKGVLLEGGRAVFNGKIHVYHEAQKTNAFQQNNNLLLSENATIHSKPQLEIFADDVKCSHGSTVGQFSPDALFYLQSRGIGENAARALLVNAFAADVVNKVPNEPLRKHIEKIVRNTIANSYD